MLASIVVFIITEFIAHSFNLRKTYIAVYDWYILPFRLIQLLFNPHKVRFKYQNYASYRQRSLSGLILNFCIKLKLNL